MFRRSWGGPTSAWYWEADLDVWSDVNLGENSAPSKGEIEVVDFCWKNPKLVAWNRTFFSAPNWRYLIPCVIFRAWFIIHFHLSYSCYVCIGNASLTSLHVYSFVYNAGHLWIFGQKIRIHTEVSQDLQHHVALKTYAWQFCWVASGIDLHITKLTFSMFTAASGVNLLQRRFFGIPWLFALKSSNWTLGTFSCGLVFFFELFMGEKYWISFDVM